MTVICQACQTHNRDRAMFCRGCAAKLPAFAATGPSALQTQPAPLARPRGSTPHAAQPRQRLMAVPGAWGWFAAVLLLGAALIALLSWVALAPLGPGTGHPPRATPAAATAPASAAVAPSTRVPFEATLAPGESPVERTAPAAAPPPAPVAAPAPPRVTTPAPKPAAVEAPRPADPRVGCEHLFFAFAARCEANHCAQAPYARHPRCDEVRAQRQRDEARRNLNSGY